MKNVNNLCVRNYPGRYLKVIAQAVLCLLITTTAIAQTAKGGKKISPDLFGLFFEDINYSADGGLYAELVQN
jgi:alpha-L-arabinofuranosidase